LFIPKTNEKMASNLQEREGMEGSEVVHHVQKQALHPDMCCHRRPVIDAVSDAQGRVGI